MTASISYADLQFLFGVLAIEAGATKLWANPPARHKTLPKAVTGLAIFHALAEKTGTGSLVEYLQKIEGGIRIYQFLLMIYFD